MGRAARRRVHPTAPAPSTSRLINPHRRHEHDEHDPALNADGQLSRKPDAAGAHHQSAEPTATTRREQRPGRPHLRRSRDSTLTNPRLLQDPGLNPPNSTPLRDSLTRTQQRGAVFAYCRLGHAAAVRARARVAASLAVKSEQADGRLGQHCCLLSRSDALAPRPVARDRDARSRRLLKRRADPAVSRSLRERWW
jgi:hypothetical protein